MKSISNRRLMVLITGVLMAVSLLAAAGMAWAQEVGTLPADPSGLTATAVSDSQIDLSWTDNATDETAYVVERSLDGSTGWTVLSSTLLADTTSYSDTGLSDATTYHYRVKAANASGDSGYSNTASATTSVSGPPTLSQTPDNTWMTDGTVHTVIRDGNWVYVGGKFTTVRSAPRSNPKGEWFTATNLARFNAETGVGDPNWTPDVTGADMTKTYVYALAAAGGKIWVGGKFDAVDGLARRNLAVVSPDSGGEVLPIAPSVGSATSKGIRAMVASDTKVYLGGGFKAINGKSRLYLGALTLSGTVDPTWTPKTDLSVRSLEFSCDKETLFAGGTFNNAAGSNGVYSPRRTIARFDTTSGALDPWAIPQGSTGVKIGDGEIPSDLTTTCERITVSYLGPNFARSFRLDDGDTGSLAWQTKCAGDPQTVEMLGDDKVVIGGHFSQVAGEPRTRIALINLSDGLPDPSWTPAIEGKWVGPWALLVAQNHLYVGGGFTKVVTAQGSFTRQYYASFTIN